MWNGFDAGIERWLNHFAGQHAHLDATASWSDTSLLVKGGPVLILIWFCLFDRRRAGQLREGFELLVGTLLLSVTACVGARGLAIVLPFRTRPLATPLLGFHLPVGGQMNYVNWSAFPSDHAALFFALATGILMVSRRAGWFGVFWATFVVCLPRLYFGEHWPTDILAGSVIGISSIQLLRIPAVRQPLRRLTLQWYQSNPPLFFSVLFIWSCETINLFGDVRHILKILAQSL